ncbi:hypothetical protein F511_06366 [Dorcoceras hygrometricum]|uniref:Uncharacterized protein n=1 Tax=Dorcoceras hygrometricum TaxID=472368 RepID=A0A2Z7AK54_9LAMI|nr:hypothetical protein F511_06366 [Dorcoceras hygrometricum]
MATNTERSNKGALHNFTMPCDLRWGNQRFLRCMKVNSDGQISPLRRFTTTTTGAHSSHHHHRHRHAGTRDREKRESSADGSRKVGSTPPPADHGIAAVREKVMLDLQTAADKMKDAIFKEGLEEGVASVPVSPPQPLAVFPTPAMELPHGETRPWSLRTRRAACRTTPLNGFSSGRYDSGGFTRSDCGGRKGLTVDASRPISEFSPVAAVAADKSPVLRSGGEKKDREKFSVALSKRAIEEDFLTMVNHRPPRRPKKRAKFIQKQLDTLFPGLWLTEVTADMYKVAEAAP